MSSAVQKDALRVGCSQSQGCRLQLKLIQSFAQNLLSILSMLYIQIQLVTHMLTHTILKRYLQSLEAIVQPSLFFLLCVQLLAQLIVLVRR